MSRNVLNFLFFSLQGKDSDENDVYLLSQDTLKPSLITPRRDTSSGWASKLEIPKRFSQKTMQCLQSGVVSRNARVEIISALHSRMIQHSEFPNILKLAPC